MKFTAITPEFPGAPTLAIHVTEEEYKALLSAILVQPSHHSEATKDTLLIIAETMVRGPEEGGK